tara:strand:- start:12 stop:518 length:507 start_codon:yes stop_codon:yes gene_type:complete
MNDKDWELFKKSVSPLKGKKKMFAMSKSTLTQSKVDKKEVNLELMDISASEDWGGLEKNILKKIHKGRILVSATLDLHGNTILDSKKLVLNFINNNFKVQNRLLLIITGKGKRVFQDDKWTREGKLKKEVPVWLNSLALNNKVIWFDHAPPNKGGEGAFLVYLKKTTK